MNYKTFEELRKSFKIELNKKLSNKEMCDLFIQKTRNELMDCVIENYQGIKDFKKEYRQVNDTMLIDDSEMLLKMYPKLRVKLGKSLLKFKEIKSLYNNIIIKEIIIKD